MLPARSTRPDRPNHGHSRDRHKLDLALELGADVAVDVERDDPVEAALELTEGRGARVVVDTTPYATEPVTQAVRVAAREGTVVIAGLKGGRTAAGFPPDELSLRELTVRGVRGVRQEAFVRAIELIEGGTVPLERLNTHAFDVADAERAVRTLAGDYPDEQPIHVAIVPARLRDGRRRNRYHRSHPHGSAGPEYVRRCAARWRTTRETTHES